MLTYIGTRTLGVHAAPSKPVHCRQLRAPVLVRHSACNKPVQHLLQARSVQFLCRAAAEEVTAAEQATDAATDSGRDKPRSQGRKQQPRRSPRGDSTNSSSSSRADDSSAASDANRTPTNTLFVNNLAWSTLSEDLQEAFSSCAGFTDAFIMLNKDKRPAGFGFVRFSSVAAATAALEAMNDTVLDGRIIKARFARPGRTDAAGADNGSSSNNADSAPSNSSSSSSSSGKASSKFDAAAETETRVVVGNLPAGFTWREVMGMCAMFGEVKGVKLFSKGKSSSNSKSSSSAVPASEAADAAAEQMEQDAPAVDGDAADYDEEQQQQQQQQAQVKAPAGAAAIAMMADRQAAETVIAELDGRVVQGSRLRANLWRRRASKADTEDAPAAA